MESYLTPDHYDLVTPDGRITKQESLSPTRKKVSVHIEAISPAFVGYEIDKSLISFNLKSSLAQLGLHAITKDIEFSNGSCEVEVELLCYGELGKAILNLIGTKTYLGKLFAADDRRRVRNLNYLNRLFGRSDRKDRPLLSLGSLEGDKDLIIEKSEGRLVAFLSALDGTVSYNMDIYGFLPTLAKALKENMPHARKLLHLNQFLNKGTPRSLSDGKMLLVKTAPLHIRTVYARVVETLLPKGFHHTSANILQPDTFGSGDIYELFGNSDQILDNIPLEFYTLEPHREHIFFQDRDQLVSSLENPEKITKAFNTAPKQDHLASVFVVKGSQMEELQGKDWIVREPLKYDFPGLVSPTRQGMLAEKYIEHQPAYPFLKAIEDGLITSQGVLFCRHFPSPLLKRMLLSDEVARCLKRIYFQYPSCSYDGFFSHEDRSFLVDLAKFGIPVYWTDPSINRILKYVHKMETDSGMFVPLESIDTFRKATLFGIYGSNLQEGNFEQELEKLLFGILALSKNTNHHSLSKDTPLALVTGGGPGAMEVGNRVAKKVGILSCANIMDFRMKNESVVNEQRQNPHIDAKMTYRLDRLVERQAEFYLDFPIFLPGGIGMDFEFTLEEVRRKTGATPSTPVLLFGGSEYWKRKITARFQLNQETGTTKGSEWVSNCFYCVETAEQGLAVYEQFFKGTLAIGKGGPIYPDGFKTHS